MELQNSQKYQIAVVLRALDVLELLASSGQPMGAAEVASHLDILRNGAFRLLSTLRSRGYVEQDAETRKYWLGLRLFQLGNAVFGGQDIRRLAFPILEDLRNRFQETVNLALLDGEWVLYVERIESPRSLRTSTAIGTRVPLYCSSLGKAILAHLPPEQVDALLSSGLHTARTENTITDPQALLAELEVIRRRGYALDKEENMAGVRCVGAPIFDSLGRAFAAVSVSGPTQRIAEHIAQGEIARDVMSAARQISERLGHVSSTSQVDDTHDTKNQESAL